MAILYNPTWSHDRRKELRTSMTPAEQKIWLFFRRDAFGVRFRRQFGIGPYIVDFYVPKLKFVLELDGRGHDDPDVKVYDAQRDAYLRGLGMTVLRVKNIEAMFHIEGVLRTLEASIKALIRYKSPSYQEGDTGGGERRRKI